VGFAERNLKTAFWMPFEIVKSLPYSRMTEFIY
jgi:hypothetical protein